MKSQHPLLKTMSEVIASGLQRKTMSKCSKWAEKCRVMGSPYPGPWTFDHHPWLREMHDSDDNFNVGMKAAQLGFTENALNRTFYMMDVRKLDCLYILPAKTPDATDFSASRFNPAIELSTHLQNLYQDVQNIGHKRAGTVNLYIRGSRSRAGLKSIPCAFIVLDEVDEMDQENIPLALERQSGQVEKQVWAISTPTIEMTGIDRFFQLSKKKHFFFPCPHCSRQIELTYPKCLVVVGDDPNSPRVRDSHIICPECGHKLDHNQKVEFLKPGIWVPGEPNNEYNGYAISQLYSSTVSPAELAMLVLLARSNPAYEQELYNSKLGLTHTVAGAKLSENEIKACYGGYSSGYSSHNKIVTMGIDVGLQLHYVVSEWETGGSADVNMTAKERVLEAGTKLTFEELDQVVYSHKPNYTVIDANPERRKAYEFAQRFYGFVSMCFYGNNCNGKQISKTKSDDGTELEHCVTVDRTSWLDLSLSRFRNKTVVIPNDISREFIAHLQSPTRVYKMNKNEMQIGVYVNSLPDHFAHAHNYAEIALKLATSFATTKNC